MYDTQCILSGNIVINTGHDMEVNTRTQSSMEVNLIGSFFQQNCLLLIPVVGTTLDAVFADSKLTKMPPPEHLKGVCPYVQSAVIPRQQVQILSVTKTIDFHIEIKFNVEILQ